MTSEEEDYKDEDDEETEGNYKDDSNDEDPKPALKKWFLDDMDAVKAGHRDTNTQSWYTQLSRVASGILVQCVLMCNGHQSRGGSKVHYDKDRLRQVLERIPTPARTDQPPRFCPSLSQHALSVSG